MYNHFSVSGWATVYIALETAAFTLAKSLTDETVNVVNFKYVETGKIVADSHDLLNFSRYGGKAGKFTENALYSVGNVGVAYHNVSNLGVKAVAKRAAKDTGKALVVEHQTASKRPVESKSKEDCKTKESCPK